MEFYTLCREQSPVQGTYHIYMTVSRRIFFNLKIQSDGVDLQSNPKHGTINKGYRNETSGMLQRGCNFMFALKLYPVAFGYSVRLFERIFHFLFAFNCALGAQESVDSWWKGRYSNRGGTATWNGSAPGQCRWLMEEPTPLARSFSLALFDAFDDCRLSFTSFECSALSIVIYAPGPVNVQHLFTATFMIAVVLYAEETNKWAPGYKFDISEWPI